MRKVSSHKTVLVHFHDDGEVCPQSFGGVCPQGGIDHSDGIEPASPSFLSKLPNGFNFRKISDFNGISGNGAGGNFQDFGSTGFSDFNSFGSGGFGSGGTTSSFDSYGGMQSGFDSGMGYGNASSTSMGARAGQTFAI